LQAGLSGEASGLNGRNRSHHLFPLFADLTTYRYHGGGCFLDTTAISEGQAYLIETVLSFCLIVLAFGVGLDPRQAQVFGPKQGPFLTACALGLIGFASISLGEWYQRAGLNPSRCFAYAVARGNFEHQRIWWVGPLTGGLAQTVMYHIVPPYHKEIMLENQTRRE